MNLDIIINQEQTLGSRQLLIIQNLLLILNIIQGGIDCIYHQRKLIYKLYEGVSKFKFDGYELTI